MSFGKTLTTICALVLALGTVPGCSGGSGAGGGAVPSVTAITESLGNNNGVKIVQGDTIDYRLSASNTRSVSDSGTAAPEINVGMSGSNVAVTGGSNLGAGSYILDIATSNGSSSGNTLTAAIEVIANTTFKSESGQGSYTDAISNQLVNVPEAGFNANFNQSGMTQEQAVQKFCSYLNSGSLNGQQNKGASMAAAIVNNYTNLTKIEINQSGQVSVYFGGAAPETHIFVDVSAADRQKARDFLRFTNGTEYSTLLQSYLNTESALAEAKTVEGQHSVLAKAPLSVLGNYVRI